MLKLLLEIDGHRWCMGSDFYMAWEILRWMNASHKSQGVQQQFSGGCENRIGLCLSFYESIFLCLSFRAA